MTTVAFMPVRGNSKSIPRKNIKLLNGRPLLHWTLDAALKAKEVDRVVVSSDSEEVLRVAAQLSSKKITLLKRPAEFATDTASTESAMLHYSKNAHFDRIVLLQATSPLTSARDIDGALRKMEETESDSVLSVTHEHRFIWRRTSEEHVRAENYRPKQRPRRQDWAGELVENGALYACRREALLTTGCRLNGKVTYWIMPAHTAVELDTPDDWKLLESLMLNETSDRARESIRLLITDVDGVLTDGGMYYGLDGEALKKFNTRDGMGIRFWKESGRKIAIVTGEESAATSQRAKKLDIDDIHVGVSDKLPLVRKIAKEYGVQMKQIAYIGDDLNDLEAIRAVGFAGCPSDAHQTIQQSAHYVCSKKGGGGCVREFIEYLLSSPKKG